jgi:uncharacterized protein DUF6220
MAQDTVETEVGSSLGASTQPPERETAMQGAPIDLSPIDRRSGRRTAGRIIFVAASWLLVAGLVGQVFLAGLGVFDSPDRFELHASFGFTLMALPLIMLLSALAGGVGRRFVGLAGLMFGLFFLQSILVSLRGEAPAIAALHPLNGFLILFVSILVARGSLEVRRPATADPDLVA